jgi:two-component system copper resistance phosphate regulon response regulator CusR
MTAANPAEVRPFRALVVEDEAKTRAVVQAALEAEQGEVVAAGDLADARRRLEATAFDLVVLDRNLPDGDGLALLPAVRTQGSAAVLMLTARSGLDDRVAGLERGADDYLAKPFALAELLARCRALLRRQSGAPPTVLQCGDLQLDTRARVVRRAGEEIPLTPREVDLLEYLLRHRGRVVSRSMLERDVWRQTRRLTSLDNVIDVQFMRLRKKIDAGGGARLLHTVRGIGYRLGGDDA